MWIRSHSNTGYAKGIGLKRKYIYIESFCTPETNVIFYVKYNFKKREDIKYFKKKRKTVQIGKEKAYEMILHI